jgi:hypothetical protein
LITKGKPMARSKLIAILLLITLTAIQAFTPFQHWYSPYLAASLIILLTAVLQKTGSNNDN